jgi:hypothetical protein
MENLAKDDTLLAPEGAALYCLPWTCCQGWATASLKTAIFKSFAKDPPLLFLPPIL